MGKLQTIEASDGHRLQAYVSTPQGQSCGGLVVAQDAYGLTEYIRSVCDAYANDGYATIAPALYDRQKPGAIFEHGGEARDGVRQFRAGLVWGDVLKDVAAAMDQVRPYGRVGIVGFCVGGSVAWLAGASLPFAAVSAYYGKDIVDFLATPPKCPAILHYGDRDHLISMQDIETVRASHSDIPTFVYPTGHGFDGPGNHHHPEAALIARQRTLDLFRKHVG